MCVCVDMALVWSGSDWVRRGQGSDTESESEGRAPAPAFVARVANQQQVERVAYRFGIDMDTLEAAVVLVVFQRYARHFGMYRYRLPIQ